MAGVRVGDAVLELVADVIGGTVLVAVLVVVAVWPGGFVGVRAGVRDDAGVVLVTTASARAT